MHKFKDCTERQLVDLKLGKRDVSAKGQQDCDDDDDDEEEVFNSKRREIVDRTKRKTRMMWKVFLVAAAAMAVCLGPRASGGLLSALDELGKAMFDNWYDKKYGKIEVEKEDRDVLDAILQRMATVKLDDIEGTRQECRTLSDDSRRRTFACYKKMASGSRMAAIEAMHRSIVAPNAHFGPCFVPWHRLYMAVVEELMRSECNDRNVSLCYWDVTLDSQLPNPCESALFTDTFYGNDNGPVITGPYANKKCLPDCLVDGSQALLRQCGGMAALSTRNDILQLINAPNYTALVSPYDMSLIESIHGENHMFVGGQMQLITCSPCDIMFFGLHSYIGLVANMNFQRRGTDVNQEYPQGLDIPPFHQGFDRMLPFTSLSCAEGLGFRPGYTPYVPPVVTCDGHDACGSKALWCNGGRCIACVRGGARMMTGWPDRACFIENCGNPGTINGVCGCRA